MRNRSYVTWVPACACNDGVIKRLDGRLVCRWCRKPWRQGGHMLYALCHFKAPYGVPIK